MAEWRIRGHRFGFTVWKYLRRTPLIWLYNRLWLAYYYRESEHDTWTRVG